MASTPRRSGWTFHPIQNKASECSDNIVGGSDTNVLRDCGQARSSSMEGFGTPPSTSQVVNDFDSDGFVAISSLFTPQFTAKLREECTEIFNGTCEYLFLTDRADFKTSYRPHKTEQSAKDELYEYPLKVGLKNGYRELVMRSPGRYELALLLDDLPEIFEARDPDYNGKWLLSTNVLNHANSWQGKHRNLSANATQPHEDQLTEVSSLKQLLEWVRNCTKCNNQTHNSDKRSGDNNRKRNEQHPIDQKNMEEFMKLVSDIFPSSEDVNESCSVNINSNKSTCIKDDNPSNNKHKQQNGDQNSDGFYLCNLSLLMATPGCPTQSWHADGGHISLTTHKRCHVFNTFIYLGM